MIDILNEDPSYGMKDNETLVYDLLPFLQQIVQNQALWADVMTALRDPISRRSGAAYATLLKYKDSDSVPAAGGPYDACFQGCKASAEGKAGDRLTCHSG